MINDINDVKIKAQFYFEKKSTIHLETKDKQFYNGLITQLSDNHLVINDRMLGEVFVVFSEVYDLDIFREKKEVGE